MIKVVLLFLVIVSVPVATFARQKGKERPAPPTQKELQKLSENASLKIPKGASFFIQPIEQNPNKFSLLLSDSNNRTVADTFSLYQMQIFEAVLIEAKKFGESNEGAGTVDVPTITRFLDKKEPYLIVDVEKVGLQTRFYVTLSCLTGHVTVDAGAIKRDGKEHDILFTKFLSRLQSLKATPQQN